MLFIIGKNDNSLNVQYRGQEKQIVTRMDYKAALNWWLLSEKKGYFIYVCVARHNSIL